VVEVWPLSPPRSSHHRLLAVHAQLATLPCRWTTLLHNRTSSPGRGTHDEGFVVCATDSKEYGIACDGK
jgi:hypothetical protein